MALPPAPGWVGELFQRFGIDSVETWEDAKWEAFSLESLWQVCCAGVQSIPMEMQAESTAIRHRKNTKAIRRPTDSWLAHRVQQDSSRRVIGTDSVAASATC